MIFRSEFYYGISRVGWAKSVVSPFDIFLRASLEEHTTCLALP